MPDDYGGWRRLFRGRKRLLSERPPVRAAIVGVAGEVLTDDEAALFRASPPAGFILFARNCRDRPELRALTDSLRAVASPRPVPILVDQEGGRVMRLKPPHWRHLPAAGAVGALALADADEAAFLAGRLIAHDLREVGIDVACVPVLDLRFRTTVKAIGDRAYGASTKLVTRLGRRMREGLVAGGILPVIKHLPGHGRAVVDSHLTMPRVAAPLATLAGRDFVPFRRHADALVAMTAHILYTAVDAERPATQSPTVIADVIRGMIGFEGLLLSDDLSMEALQGTIGERARIAVAAGCDIALHCNGKLDELRDVLGSVPVLADRARWRYDAAMAGIGGSPQPFDAEAGDARLAALMTMAA